MKKYFFSGLAILLPIALTAMILLFFIDLLTTPFIGVVNFILEKFQKEGIDTEKYKVLFLFLSRVFVLILLVIAIFLLGFIAQRFLIRNFLAFINKLLLRVPVVKKIYRVSVDITKSFVGKSEKIFQKTVMVSFPHKDSKTIGFLTGDVPKNIQEKCPESSSNFDLKSVFVPTSPHPISGFLIMLSKENIYDVNLSTEDAFKILVSCGLYYPEK